MLIKTIILLVFFAIMIGVGIYTRQRVKSVDDFILGGRGIGPWFSAFAYGTTYFSAVVFVGYAGQFGWKYGMAATWIGIGNALLGSMLAWAVLGRRTRIMTNHISASTMPEFFGKRYGSNSMKIVASAIIFIFMIPYTASIYNGLSRLFAMAFDVPFAVCVITMAVLTGIYVILGGYVATVLNDFIQGIIMLFGIIAVIVVTLSNQGGFMQAVFNLSTFPSEAAISAGQSGAYTSLLGPDPLNLLGVIVLTSLGTWGLPQMVQKFYAIKSEKMIKTGMIVSTLFALIIAGGCYFLGGFGRLFDSPAIRNADSGAVIYDSIIPHIMSTLPDLLIGIVVVLVLSASMSTLAALVLTSSTTLSLDFIKGNIIKKMSEKSQLFTLRLLIVFFIAISVVLALNPPTFIAQLMGISWGAMAGAFLAPFLYGLYWKQVSRAAVWASFFTGVGITVSNLFLHYIESAINAGAIAMIVSLIVVPLVSLIIRQPQTAEIDQIFSCYQEKVTVPRWLALEYGIPEDSEHIE